MQFPLERATKEQREKIAEAMGIVAALPCSDRNNWQGYWARQFLAMLEAMAKDDAERAKIAAAKAAAP